MINILSKAVIAAAITLAASVVIAGSPRGHSGPPFERDPAQMVAHMAERLDLSEDQQSQITTLLEAEKGQVQNDREQLQNLRQQLIAMEGDFDSDTARAISDEMGVISGRLAYSRASTFSEINHVLSEEQREQLSEFMQGRSGRRAERHKNAKHGR